MALEMKNKLNTPLTDDELEKALGIRSDKIVKYSELKNYNTLDELLPSIGSFKIILIESSYNRGHWVCVVRGHVEYYYFNSYGNKYDADWSWISRMTRKVLGEETNELTRLFKGVKNDWNKVKMQGKTTQVCGRYCIIACVYLGKMMYSMDELNKFLKDKKKESNYKTYDEVCVKLTEMI